MWRLTTVGTYERQRIYDSDMGVPFRRVYVESIDDAEGAKTIYCVSIVGSRSFVRATGGTVVGVGMPDRAYEKKGGT
jgi:hypothetical protein